MKKVCTIARMRHYVIRVIIAMLFWQTAVSRKVIDMACLVENVMGFYPVCRLVSMASYRVQTIAAIIDEHPLFRLQ